MIRQRELSPLLWGGVNLASVGGEINVNGDIEAVYGQANVLLTPFGSKKVGDGTLTPLFGGGIGFVDWEDTVDSISAGGTTLAVNGKESDTDGLISLIIGFDYSQNQNLSVGFRYKHGWADTGKNGFDDAEVDNITGNLTYRF